MYQQSLNTVPCTSSSLECLSNYPSNNYALQAEYRHRFVSLFFLFCFHNMSNSKVPLLVIILFNVWTIPVLRDSSYWSSRTICGVGDQTDNSFIQGNCLQPCTIFLLSCCDIFKQSMVVIIFLIYFLKTFMIIL